ncbi:response regulator transcription factor [Pseudohongiella nitratireducens]|uniref:response regulator transcription factor n=1 Tax=Pseudohongiella nitratireducens TaxID=1768907 RepID=UPI0030EEE74A
MLKQLNDESLPPSLVISSRTDQTFADALMAYGANGIIHKNEPVALLTKAIMRVAEGELWLDRAATGRIFQKMARSRIDNEASADLQKLSTLTRKERTITTLVGEQPSASGQSLAEQLNISEHTLRNHLSNIYAKLVISGRVELYAFAQKNSHHFPGSGSEHSV